MKNVQCPHCHKTVAWSEDSPYRPFCSRRCRLIDLGAWADGSYSIPVASLPMAANAPEALEEGEGGQANQSDEE